MSIKKFNTEEDIFSNQYFNRDLIRINQFYFSGSDLPVPNYKLPNHYVTGGVSGSWYLEIYDKRNDSPSANRLMSITYGYITSSAYFTGNFQPTYQSQKLRMYRLLAKRLLGGEDRTFKIGGREIKNALFVLVARNQYKDGFLIGEASSNTSTADESATLYLFNSGSPGTQTTSDFNYYEFSNAAAGQEYSGKVYYDSTSINTGAEPANKSNAILFEKAGIIVVDADSIDLSGASSNPWSGSLGHEQLAKGVSGSTFNDLLWACKHRIFSFYFNSFSKTACTFFRCTAGMNEFNYSSNPSFVGPSKEIITALSATTPTVYFTQIGLMNENDEVIAVARVKQPIKKHFDVGVTVTVRLDY